MTSPGTPPGISPETSPGTASSAAGGPALPVADLVERLQAGAAVLFPTDTLPALAALPAHAEQIWSLKQRPADKPLILMAADLEQLGDVLGSPWLPAWRAMAEQGWPGALTLVLPARGAWLESLHPGGTSLGLRIPACPLARQLLRASGPLATTSANLAGEAPATTAAEARAVFPRLPLLAPLPWPPAGGTASTVLAWRQEGWTVLRAGAWLPDELRH